MCDDRFEFSSVIRGHHVYKDIFMPTIRRILQSGREPDNSYDSFAVAIIKNDTIVGCVPRNISRLKYFHRAISNSPLCVERKNLNGYTGNYEDIYFQSLLSIREILNNFYPQK